MVIAVRGLLYKVVRVPYRAKRPARLCFVVSPAIVEGVFDQEIVPEEGNWRCREMPEGMGINHSHPGRKIEKFEGRS